MIFTKKSITYLLIITGAIAVITGGCHRKSQKIDNDNAVAAQLSFKPIAGINFTEIRRRLITGLSFDKYGFQTEPGYKITFLTNDSASVYSPDKKAFINFYVFIEKDSIFNVARSYFKMRHMSKDSLILQVLEVEGDTLHTRRSLVFMTFYANKYISEHHLDTAQLSKPDSRDTMFIKTRSAIANRVRDSAFSARQPVELSSRTPLLTISRNEIKPDMLNNFDASDFYMNPEYNITIYKAYEDFSYSFAVFVDDKGKMYFDKSMDYIMPEFKEATTKTIKGIIDGYLTAYLKVKPGSTLGIKHTSFVILNVTGKK